MRRQPSSHDPLPPVPARGAAAVLLPDLLFPHLSPPSTPPSREASAYVASFPLRRYDGAEPSVHLYALSWSSSPPLPANARATTLAFSCGLHSLRLRGDVAVCRVVGEGGGAGAAVASDFGHGEIVVRPDLRGSRDSKDGGRGAHEKEAPEWLEGAAQANYSYKSEVARLKCAFKQAPDDGDDSEDEDDDDDDDDSAVVLPPAPPTPSSHTPLHTPLCLHCRAPASTPCPNCFACHFCSPSCASSAWSHACVCDTWREYKSNGGKKLKEFK
eukprot:CAMPEP_0182463298 /NCGR_PEP_ID=MMETSP1319-20130603/7260_1 /TAXON_ID=172717 /ORGANISM="Bolidomonas pacifica, Strain RCC208" /LENGTH=270 /DNA_ID=CAMNT_0024662823 /DNA_START=34 /DNA_END=844 /DNA_ORIENTATION=+